MPIVETGSKRVTLRLIVVGRVQGVSYRASLRDRALGAGVDGWVRNLDDGSVEALLQGEETDVRRVADWARVGPPAAEVSGVIEEVQQGYPRLSGFRVAA
ncbi:MAG: acylphosphatase [Nitrososphaerales archaeon]|jgi:acylphosphatase